MLSWAHSSVDARTATVETRLTSSDSAGVSSMACLRTSRPARASRSRSSPMSALGRIARLCGGSEGWLGASGMIPKVPCLALRIADGSRMPQACTFIGWGAPACTMVARSACGVAYPASTRFRHALRWDELRTDAPCGTFRRSFVASRSTPAASRNLGRTLLHRRAGARSCARRRGGGRPAAGPARDPVDTPTRRASAPTSSGRACSQSFRSRTRRTAASSPRRGAWLESRRTVWITARQAAAPPRGAVPGVAYPGRPRDDRTSVSGLARLADHEAAC